MNPQFLVDGVLTGSLLGLGAIGLTLVYALLGFANFAHGETATVGAYAALLAAPAFGGQALGGFTFGLGIGPAMLCGMVAAAAYAVALDRVLFRRLRARGSAIALVIGSFGASLATRSLVEFAFGPQPRHFSRDIPDAVRLLGVRASWDQLAVVVVAAALMVAMHLVMTRSPLGRAMRAVGENASLARLGGIDVERVVRTVWIVGGALAAAAGVLLGVVVQVRPYMGFDLLLPLFAAAILGGIGSVPGAAAGGLVIGLAEAAAVPLVGAQYRAAVAFLVLLAVLLVRPTGLFGARAT